MSQLSKEYTSAFFNSSKKPRQLNTKVFCEGLVSITTRNTAMKNNFLTKYDNMIRELSSSSINHSNQRLLSPPSIIPDHEPLSKLNELKRELSKGKDHSKNLKDLLFQKPQPINLNLNSLVMNVSLKSKKNNKSTTNPKPNSPMSYKPMHTHSNSMTMTVNNNQKSNEKGRNSNNFGNMRRFNTHRNGEEKLRGSFAFGTNKDSSQLYTMRTMTTMNDFYDEILTSSPTNNHNNTQRNTNGKMNTVMSYKKKPRKVVDYATIMKIHHMKNSISNDLRSFSSRKNEL